mmetsp:Transcript_3529/g.12590  ORF Transcript_3529/g.12590 Transcript_3529/m.12590 type:complete len:225 (-) Transcript_3529:1690-2364(-)
MRILSPISPSSSSSSSSSFRFFFACFISSCCCNNTFSPTSSNAARMSSGKTKFSGSYFFALSKHILAISSFPMEYWVNPTSAHKMELSSSYINDMCKASPAKAKKCSFTSFRPVSERTSRHNAFSWSSMCSGFKRQSCFASVNASCCILVNRPNALSLAASMRYKTMPMLMRCSRRGSSQMTSSSILAAASKFSFNSSCSFTARLFKSISSFDKALDEPLSFSW